MAQRILANDKEVEYATTFGVQDRLNLNLIPYIKRISSRNRSKFTRDRLDLFVKDLERFITKYSRSKILPFFQFNKGDIKSMKEFSLINDVQIQSTSDAFVLQEISKEDTLQYFKKIVLKYKDVPKEIFLVLEIESKEIEDKIKFAASNGIRNFIIRGGDYYNLPKWMEVRQLIRTVGGLFIISLPRRMDKHRVSYFRYALDYGCDYAFHEKPAPYPVATRDVLNLDDNFVYVSMQFSEGYGKALTDKNLYDFSRVRTLFKAEELSINFPVL